MGISRYQKKFLINVGMVAVILLSLIAFIIMPAINDIIKINQEITAERIALLKKFEQGLNIKKIEEELAEIEESIEELDKILIKTGQELKFITELENLAQNNQIDININPDFSGAPTAGKNIKIIPLQINLSGEYRQLINFLQDLERMPYYYNLNLTTFSSRSRIDTGPINLQLTGQTYAQIPQ